MVLAPDRSDGQAYATAALPVAPDEGWKRYAFALAPSRSDPLAKLAVLFIGPAVKKLNAQQVKRHGECTDRSNCR